ncbi:hypothetical protein [Microbacterium sp. Leaf436]|uniref:hypothetical protein n=1 Tax=Microbacterium sp. Leaf436 TaxID=1736377 RepID=UPI001F30F612|nr:hypothetical protein [Microbacterium sp. Leaf436]
MTREDAARAAAQLRPAWSDHCLTETVIEPGAPTAVRFAVEMDGVEAHQWADEVDGMLVLTGSPAIGLTRRAGEVSDRSLTDASELGATLMRVSQYVALANDVATDVSRLRMSDLARIARLRSVDAVDLLMAVNRRAEEETAAEVPA